MIPRKLIFELHFISRNFDLSVVVDLEKFQQ